MNTYSHHALRFAIFTLALSQLIGPVSGVSSRTALAQDTLKLPPLPVLAPTALSGDAGDGRVYLRWNLQLEDERVVGWKVRQLKPTETELTRDVISEPSFVVRPLANGTPCTFTVVGVLRDGRTTPPSNAVTVTPRATGEAKLVPLAPSKPGETAAIGQFQGITFGPQATKVVFPDGQELIYDQMRPVDWKARNGVHLIYPRPFGNGLDIGSFDDRGLPVVIGPDGVRHGVDSSMFTGITGSPAAIAPGGAPHGLPTGPRDRDPQAGSKHPWLTDPMTQPIAGPRSNDARTVWRPPVVDGDRVTFHYWLPLTAMGYHSWTYVLVWETWWPIERERHGAKYHGLARLVEVEMFSALKRGYQVMLNNGFGPGGSRQGVVSYSTGFREPGHEIVDFSGDKNRQVIFQSPKPPRQGYGYHPDHDCLQASPLIFYDWGTGCLTIAARSLYYHCANMSSSYIEQGADGVWPNLAWDLAAAGKRTAVDTVEYLYTADAAQPLPQRFLSARFEAYGDVSRRMGVQSELGAVAMDAPHSQMKPAGGPTEFARKYLEKVKGTGIDVVAMYHDTWQAVPITVDDAYRLDENHDCNPQLKRMCKMFREAGFHPGLWFRPEFTKTSLPAALSERIPTAEVYYGYDMAHYPEVVDLLQRRGIPLFRDNPTWSRLRRDGTYPYETSYQWVPMSMTGDWWNRIIWPSLDMTSRLGFDRVLVDGGFGGMQGVDYTPMHLGRANGAVALQPYWWRFWRTLHHVGIRAFGECTMGWKGGNVSAGGKTDELYPWMFHLGWYIGQDGAFQAPEPAHRLFQLYNSLRADAGNSAVRRYARKFYESHRAPDWIELRDLRQLGPVELTVKVGDSPVAGGETRSTRDATVKLQARPWTWSDVVWHYDDGTTTVYPAYERVDWSKQ